MKKASACFSRREFLAGLAAFAFPLKAEQTKTWVYTGCYTTRGQGITVYEMNQTTGQLQLVRVVPAGTNPSFIALHPNGRYLYAVNEIANYENRQTGSVRAFSVDSDNGNLTELNIQPTEGRSPAHVSVDPSGRYVMTANYTGGNVSLLPVRTDGTLEAPVAVVNHTGQLGPNAARQEAPHAHMILPDPTGRFALANDLGLDRTFIYRLDRAEGRLVATSAPNVATPGAGPRHLAFHPNGRFVFVINELDSTMSSYGWNPENGAMSHVQTLSTLPAWYAGINTTAQVVVPPDGRFVYGPNRGHDSIAIFALDPATGQMSYTGEQWTFGETPRNFNIDPSGRFMYVAHQNTDNIATFRIDQATGKLELVGQLLTTGNPVCIIFDEPPAQGESTVEGVTFVATPNRIWPGSNGLGVTTLAWNAPSATDVEIHIASPNGPNMGRHPNSGVTTTDAWVADGMSFYLQDVSGGKPLTSANTLGTVRVSLRR
jgi:6-phosphogluconolactonase